MSRLSVLAAGLLAVLPHASAFCGSRLPHLHGRMKRQEGEKPAFGYGILDGPLNWAQLDPAFATCNTGTLQSPVIIDNSFVQAAPGSVRLDLPTGTDVVFENLGTTVEVVANGTLTADDDTSGSTWQLAQFHFHTPSEHRVDLAHADGEMHMVFKAADDPNKIAVAAFMIDVSADATTSMLETVFSQLGQIQEAGSSTLIPSLDFADFLDQASAQSFFRYTGSLTTPPCSEGVEWYVASNPIPLSAATYLSLKATTKTNNRFSQNAPLQPNVLSIAAGPATGLDGFIVGGNGTQAETGGAIQENAVAQTAPAAEGAATDLLTEALQRFNPLVPVVGKRRLAKEH